MAKPQSCLSGLFIVGTDTGVGKTFVTSRIARQLLDEGVSVGVYKPVCSGSEEHEPDQHPTWQDVETHAAALNQQFPRECICPQRFLAPLAPPVAARLEHRIIDESLLFTGIDWWRERVELLLIEGVGGLLCPLSERLTVCDLAVALGFPVLVVGRLGLGTINHTLLTVEVAQQRGLRVAGILLNESRPNEAGIAGETNPSEIAARCNVPVLGVISYQAEGGLRALSETSTINWWEIAGRSFPQ